MDPYSSHKKQLEYYEYCEKQRENYIDLTRFQDNANNSIKLFAKILFSKSKNNLDQNLTGTLIEEGMDILDLFCALVELVLYGYDILTGNNILDLEECADDIIYTIKTYLRSCGFDVDFNEDFVGDVTNDACLYRDRTDYYCEILPKPPSYLCWKGWYVLDYRLIYNENFSVKSTTPLECFKAFFISHQKRIFVMKFKYTINLPI